ncbi:MAG: GNAT family N-acetyltransferase [Acidobacteria bacterium]|nr:GNAT family N-acetyltransferase [Acidobacteriota bacterium]
MSVIETERLSLRELSGADAAFILELLNDPGFIRFIADRGVRTLEGAARYIEERFAESYRQHGFGLWLVETKEGKAPAGICGLLKRGAPVPGVEVGYAFLPQFRARGYAFEAASASAVYARDVLGLPRLYAVVNPDNASSIRVLEKLGMRFERAVRLTGEEFDVNLFSTDL